MLQLWRGRVSDVDGLVDIHDSLLTMYTRSHNKADCPKPRQNTGECYNCGEHG